MICCIYWYICIYVYHSYFGSEIKIIIIIIIFRSSSFLGHPHFLGRLPFWVCLHFWGNVHFDVMIKIRLETPEIKMLCVALLSQASRLDVCYLVHTTSRQNFSSLHDLEVTKYEFWKTNTHWLTNWRSETKSFGSPR